MSRIKIVSGGQTGADQAALDVAIELGIPHGGWVPKGRKTEAGPLPYRYHVDEMPTESYPERTEQNVIDSDGTLIFTHGELSGGSAYTQDMAKKHARPCLHMDLRVINGFNAAKKVISWIQQHHIDVLNVAGPRASSDPKIYQETKLVLKTVYSLGVIGNNLPDPSRSNPYLPGTVDDAVKRLLSELSLRDKSEIAKMEERELVFLRPTLGEYIKDKYGLWTENKELMQSCRLRAGEKQLDEHGCAAFILKELWKRLKQTHLLRPVK